MFDGVTFRVLTVKEPSFLFLICASCIAFRRYFGSASSSVYSRNAAQVSYGDIRWVQRTYLKHALQKSSNVLRSGRFERHSVKTTAATRRHNGEETLSISVTLPTSVLLSMPLFKSLFYVSVMEFLKKGNESMEEEERLLTGMCVTGV